MTVIAWDGRTLAADRQACYGQQILPTTKIFCCEHRGEKVLLGVTGDLSVGLEMVAWYKAGVIAKDYPDSNRDPDKGASLHVVLSDGSFWRFESSPEPWKVEGAFCAFGSGAEGALVALACGKSAKEAVELVSRFNSTCGCGVDTLELEC